MDLQIIQNKIFEVRGCRVMLDYHLAELYQVETRALKQAVKRNIERFPGDFMFVLTQEEANLLLSIGGITFCDTPCLQLRRCYAYGFHRTGRSHAFFGSPFQNSHRGEHFNHAGFCPHAPNGNRLRGTVKAHRGTGGKHRCTVQRAISSPYPTSKPVEATERTPSGRFRYL